ncbi:hypothetical protein GCM10017744_068330 [Streptomyces antimycoticus]
MCNRRALGALTVLLMAAPAAHAAPAGPDRPELRPDSGLATRGERFDRPRLPLPWTDDLVIDRTGDVTRTGPSRCTAATGVSGKGRRTRGPASSSPSPRAGSGTASAATARSATDSGTAG